VIPGAGRGHADGRHAGVEVAEHRHKLWLHVQSSAKSRSQHRSQHSEDVRKRDRLYLVEPVTFCLGGTMLGYKC